MENLNIALVHEWITNVAGAEKVLLNLKELYPKAPIYTSVFDSKKAEPFLNMDVRTSFLQKIPFMKTKRELLIPFTPFAFEQFDLSEYDIVISSTTVAAKGIIIKPNTIHISYCHTPPRYLWEPQVDPRAKKGKLSFLRNQVMHKMRIWDRVAADRVDYFIANSAYIARRIKKYYKKDALVIYPPVDIHNFKLPEKDNRNYYIFVSRLINYKKCDVVIDAFNALKLPLKIVGYGADEVELRKRANDNIEFLGRRTGEELCKLYQGAKALIFAAEEDFGIVPVEAMACGTPVIAYNQGGVAESVIDMETGLFFNQQTSESIKDAVERFKNIKFDSQIIRNQATKFSAENFKDNFKKAVEALTINKR